MELKKLGLQVDNLKYISYKSTRYFHNKIPWLPMATCETNQYTVYTEVYCFQIDTLSGKILCALMLHHWE